MNKYLKERYNFNDKKIEIIINDYEKLKQAGCYTDIDILASHAIEKNQIFSKKLFKLNISSFNK